jgi:hypothetical protein
MSTNWKSLSTVTQGTAAVGTSSTTILAANANRTYCMLLNLSSVDITIGIEASAVLSEGIVLPSYGGFYEMAGENGNNVRGIITAIAASTATINYMQAGGGV